MPRLSREGWRRWNSPYINHFLSPDTVVPDQTNPQDWNRYSYVHNNPLRFTDPTGHYACGDGEEHDCDGHKQDPDQNPHPPKPPKPTKPNEDKDDEDILDLETIGDNEDYGCQTVTCEALSGDVYSMIKLLLPSHLGWRIQIEGTVFIFSGTIGINGVYNFVNDEFGGNLDWSLGGGPGVGAGLAVTTGPLAGWGSSNVNDVTSGNSVVVSGSAAAEWAATGAISAPVNENGFYVDPYYGQIPATLYLGGGAGGAFADAGLSYSGTFSTFP